jgi:tetratricopeptide (TPR) repeat protein
MNKFIVILFCLAFTLLAFGADGVSSKQLCAEADQEFRQGTQLIAGDAEGAQAHFEAARIRYEQALMSPESEVSLGVVYYNLGNTYARLNDLANAIVNYRRALMYTPNDADLRANLQYARSLRADHFPEAEQSRVLKTLFFWHYDLAFQSRLYLALAFGVLFWLAAIVMLKWRPLWLKCTLGVLALCYIAGSVSIACSMYESAHNTFAVVKSAEVMPRQGDSDGYSPALDAPLHAATEVRILTTRGAWCQIELPNGLTGWLPAEALIII